MMNEYDPTKPTVLSLSEDAQTTAGVADHRKSMSTRVLGDVIKFKLGQGVGRHQPARHGNLHYISTMLALRIADENSGAHQ